MRHATFILFALLAVPGLSVAQTNDTWTLQRAVDYALTNNLQVRQLQNNAELSSLALDRAKANRLPTLNASSNVGAQFGRTIDPTTNTFDQQTIGFQGIQLNAGANIYNGGLIRNGIIGLQVANNYLNIILFKEQLKNARAQLDLTTDQLANTDALIEAGALPPAQRFDLLAQQAAALSNATLGLKILLELDYTDDFEVATPELNLSDAQLLEDFNLEEVFLAARNTQPTIAAAELRGESAAIQTDLAKGQYLPTISIFGSVSTNYSTAAKDFTNPTGGDGQQALLAELVAVDGTGSTPTFPTIGYIDQLDRNFGQSVGASISVPIYSQGRKKIDLQNARVLQENARLNVQVALNNLRNDVQLALNNFRGAQQNYRAAQVSQEAAQQAYDNAQRRFRAGTANSFDLVTATNQLDQARTEFTRSKYQLIFNRQVIRFYLGQGFTLE